ncbi:MAG: serine protease [Atribacterota bacterium]|nr:serine protease [Atribacterota bacterium]MDD3031038.1 serine protease [Atribacterota bacterium]MDD3640962.1 serine protease [Atribacterota bacterium]MDD4288675.1 serine protease [Atribacterota bacterium]MDI9597321.1 serine protease [Atribacterota bacterium]
MMTQVKKLSVVNAKVYILSIIVLLVFLSLLSNSFASEDVREAIVKVYTVSNSPDYYNPWSMQGPRASSGSGCMIEGNLILTNAHVVGNQTFLQVRKYGDTQRFTARVVAVSHLTDLALLTVDDEQFFEGEPALSLGELPETQQEVLVYGFPMGGDMLSITKGVISRIEHQPYVHSSSVFLAGQIDAAINPGNSGGPVLVEDKIVGVVMAGIPSAQNIGYMVPVPVIRHFFKDIEDGSYDGYPSLGIGMQDMENEGLRKYYQMEPGASGVLINQVIPGSPADGKLQLGDVLVKIEDYPVGNDGTIEFRRNERTLLNYAVQQKQIGEDIILTVLREGNEEKLNINLSRSMKKDRLVPMEEYETLPTYYIYGGLVFCPLTKDLLNIWGSQWSQSAPRELVCHLLSNTPEREDQQIVVLLKALAAEVNQGYQNINSWVVDQINGEKIWNMHDLVEKVENCQEPFVIFEDQWNKKVIIDKEKAMESHYEILDIYRIPFDRSEDLVE